jgi:hypothetical protein
MPIGVIERSLFPSFRDFISRSIHLCNILACCQWYCSFRCKTPASERLAARETGGDGRFFEDAANCLTSSRRLRALALHETRDMIGENQTEKQTPPQNTKGCPAITGQPSQNRTSERLTDM